MLGEVTDVSFGREVLEADSPVAVDFWASWCEPCRAMVPVLEELAAALAGQVKMVKVDADASPGAVGRYGVMGLPTLLLFKDGRPVDRLVGPQPRDEVLRRLEALL